jgi:hypothetical protein
VADNQGGMTVYQGLSFGLAVLAFIMALITAGELKETSEKCELKPRRPVSWPSK